MATGVNVKMGVSGVSQFKAGMQQAQASVKSIDAALKLNEKQFKATGDSETYMEQKTQLLNTKMAEQEKIIDQAEKALETMASPLPPHTSPTMMEMMVLISQVKPSTANTSRASMRMSMSEREK